MTTKPNGQRVGYIRVSTLDQNTIRQEEQLGSYQLDKTFIDKASGKSTGRPELQRCLEHLRDGDTLIVHSMDRLARNLDDLRNIVKALTDKGVAVQFDKEGLKFTGEDSPMSQLMLSVMGAFAEFERSLIKERQREGIAIAKSKGAYVGRKKTLSEADVAELLAKDKANGHKNRTSLAIQYGVSRETLYKYLRAAEAPAQESEK